MSTYTGSYSWFCLMIAPLLRNCDGADSVYRDIKYVNKYGGVPALYCLCSNHGLRHYITPWRVYVYRTDILYFMLTMRI